VAYQPGRLARLDHERAADGRLWARTGQFRQRGLDLRQGPAEEYDASSRSRRAEVVQRSMQRRRGDGHALVG
jgi:hypothetical protein